MYKKRFKQAHQPNKEPLETYMFFMVTRLDTKNHLFGWYHSIRWTTRLSDNHPFYVVARIVIGKTHHTLLQNLTNQLEW